MSNKQQPADHASMRLKTAEELGRAAKPAGQGRGVGEECAAISTGHKFGPFGPDKETQCEYCGESPDFPECSGTPNDCPENEGYGCCKSIPKPDRHPSHTWQEDNDEQP